MKIYEMITEHFNNCSGRAVPEMSEIETDDLDAFVKTLTPPKSRVEKSSGADGVVYDILSGDIRTRYVFAEI